MHSSKFLLFALLTSILFSACGISGRSVDYASTDNARAIENGMASWYGPNFNGKLTANGEVYDMNGVTAAHRTLPFETILLVENLDNGKTVQVRINDRGPYAKD